MTISSRPFRSNMQRPRAKTPGWAAFDRKQREKPGSGAGSNADPFPSISNMAPSGSTRSLLANNSAPVKSFASVVHPTLEFPPLGVDSHTGDLDETTGAGKFDNKLTKETNVNSSVKWLKDVHSWADDNLIEDVLTAVGGDVDQTSYLLKSMVSSSPQKEEANPSAPSSSFMDSLGDNKSQGPDQNISVESELSDGVHILLAPKKLFSVPVEPEWEEDDIYLSQRKEALHMTRVASQHSRAASNAFMRGDHLSAHQLSLRAREEWLTAEKLNNKAAEEILQIRNSNNNIWKIDLHGLHASEAVSALKGHLHIIESQMLMNWSASSDGLAQLGSVVQSPSFESFSCLDIETETSKKEAPRQRQTVLQVITGTGNHSRGQASLPTAVRSFLIEHGYRFDDTRAGVLAVRPKFRHK